MMPVFLRYDVSYTITLMTPYGEALMIVCFDAATPPTPRHDARHVSLSFDLSLLMMITPLPARYTAEARGGRTLV